MLTQTTSDLIADEPSVYSSVIEIAFGNNGAERVLDIFNWYKALANSIIFVGSVPMLFWQLNNKIELY